MPDATENVMKLTYEERIAAAIHWMQSGATSNMAEAAAKFGLVYTTFQNRYTGRTKSRAEANRKLFKISPETEDVLVEWCQYLGMRGTPLNRRTIGPRVKALCGSSPTKAWFRGFVRRRQKELKLYRPSGLAPNRAQAFNQTVVGHHFDLFKAEIMEKYNIPPENMWNMDEKGIQLSGGRKQRREKYLFSRDRRPKYRIRSDKLELVTIIECASAVGVKMPPGFVLAGKTFDAAWFSEKEKIGW